MIVKNKERERGKKNEKGEGKRGQFRDHRTGEETKKNNRNRTNEGVVKKRKQVILAGKVN